jgi:hypothetical protein
VSTDAPAGGPPFFDVIMAQRACRHFADQDVGDDLVEWCLTAATHAPSAENLQPWVFVVVRDADGRMAIAELTRRLWRQMGRPASEGRLAPGLMADVDAGAETGTAGAPVLVVVCGDSSEAHRSTLSSSVYLATQNLLLTTLATLEADTLADILELPAQIHPMAVIPLGWPARPLGSPRRRPVSEQAYRERYGTPWA